MTTTQRTESYTEQTWKVIIEFAKQMNRLNAEKNYVVNEQRRLTDEGKRGHKKQVEALDMIYEKASHSMKQIDKSIDFVSRQMGFLPVDVYNEMERHWQEDLNDQQKCGYSPF